MGDILYIGTYEAGLMLTRWSRISKKAQQCLTSNMWTAMVLHDDVLHSKRPNVSDRHWQSVSQLMLRTANFRVAQSRATLTPMIQIIAHPTKPRTLMCRLWSWLTWRGLPQSTPLTLAMLVWDETKPPWAPWASFIVEHHFDAFVKIMKAQAMRKYKGVPRCTKGCTEVY